MGVQHSKLAFLYLPAQSGKTRKVEDKIRDYKEHCGLSGTKSIDIVISANNRLLVHQTTSRIKKDLGHASTSSDSDSEISDDYDKESNAVIKGNIFSWTCGGKGQKIAPDHLAFQIIGEEVEMVIMCSNKCRMDYARDMILALISKKQFKKDPIDINIWIDEADVSIKLWLKFQDILSIPAIKHVTLVSATITSVLKKFGSIRVIPYAVTHPSCYRRLKDFNRVVVDEKFGEDNGARDYLHLILERYPALLMPGMRIFSPGYYKRKTQDPLAEYLSGRDCAVLIINGITKELRIPGKPTIDMRGYLSADDPNKVPDEFNRTLAILYKKNSLHRFPFFITGFLCVQRGVTFQIAPEEDHDGFLFDATVIPDMSNPDEAYQTMARTEGNIGDFPTYKTPTVYSTANTFARVQEREEAAVNLSRIVFEEGLTSVTMDDFKRAARPPMVKCYRIHVSEDDHINFYRMITGNAPRVGDFLIQTEGEFVGFRLSTSVSNRPLSVSAAINKGGANVGGDWKRTRFPCYTDVRDSTTLRWLFVPCGGIPDPAKLAAADLAYPAILKRG